MDYIIILAGALLGMLLLTAVKSVYIQEGSKYALSFLDAFKVYTTKHTGPIVIGFIVVFIAMFVLPEFIAAAKAGDTIMGNKIINNVVDRLRLYSVGLGIVGQGLGFILIRKGEKFLRQAEKEKQTTS